MCKFYQEKVIISKKNTNWIGIIETKGLVCVIGRFIMFQFENCIDCFAYVKISILFFVLKILCNIMRIC